MYKIDVEKKLGVSEKQLNHAIKVMEKLHYFENWIYYKLGPSSDLIVFFNFKFYICNYVFIGNLFLTAVNSEY